MRYLLLVLLMSLSVGAVASNKLSKTEFSLLSQVAELIETEQYTEARQQLLAAKPTIKSDYAKALLLQNLSQIELFEENYSQALKHLDAAYNLQVLPAEQQIGLMYTLAQLNCMERQWRDCTSLLESWMKLTATEVPAADYFLLGQAYGQQEHWAKVIKAMATALDLREQAPESWYQLKVVAHIQLEQWREAIVEQQKLVLFYGAKARNWRQLVSLHLQVKDHKSALADQRIAYERGLLKEANDYRLLAQLLLEADAPFYAGKVLRAGLNDGALEENKRHLNLLTQSWIRAREFEKAAVALIRLNQVAGSEKSLTQLAHLQVQLQQWQSAEKTLLKIVKRVKKPAAKLHLLLGIVRTNLNDYDLARQDFAAAALDKKLKGQADGWMRYLQQVNPV